MEIVVETPGSESDALLHERLVAFNRENAPGRPRRSPPPPPMHTIAGTKSAHGRF